MFFNGNWPVLDFTLTFWKWKQSFIFSKSLKASSMASECSVPSSVVYVFFYSATSVTVCLLQTCQISRIGQISLVSGVFGWAQIAAWATENWVLPMLKKAVRRQVERLNQQGWQLGSSAVRLWLGGLPCASGLNWGRSTEEHQENITALYT